MPCDDISEIIELHLDESDRLRSYTLNKRTCGADIGQASLLSKLVINRSLETLMELDGQAVRDCYPDRVSDEEFLYYKHLTALQEALAVVSGRKPGGAHDACSVLAVWPENDGLTFRGLIAVQALAESIKACGNCGSCGSKRVSPVKPPQRSS